MGYGLWILHPIGRLSTKKNCLFVRFRHPTPIYFNVVPSNYIRNLGDVAVQTKKKPPMVAYPSSSGIISLDSHKRIQHKKTKIYHDLCFNFFPLYFLLFPDIFSEYGPHSSRILAGGRLRHAFIGIGFRERTEAYDFQAALHDHIKYLPYKCNFYEFIFCFKIYKSWWFQLLNF